MCWGFYLFVCARNHLDDPALVEPAHALIFACTNQPIFDGGICTKLRLAGYEPHMPGRNPSYLLKLFPLTAEGGRGA